MTPRQLAVFERLCRLQIEAGGMHSLLPHVMDALLELARRPWWDAGVAGIPDEPDPRRPDPPSRLPGAIDPDPERSLFAKFRSQLLAMKLCMGPTVALSMTRRQREVFKTLFDLQLVEGGPTSVLPNVTAELLQLACQPWWDRDMAGIPFEPEPGLPA